MDLRRTPWPACRQRLMPFAIMLVLGTIWGGAPSISKFIATEGVPPLGSVFWQAGGAAVFLYVISRLRGGRIPLGPRYLLYYLMVGFVGYALPNANMIHATREIPAGLMAVVLTMNPVCTYLMVLAFRIERVNTLRIAGIALGLAGACVLVLPRGSVPDPAMLPWLLFAFVSPLLYGFGNAWAEKFRPTGIESVTLASAMLFAASAGMGIAALATDSFYPIWRGLRLVDLVIVGYSGLSVIIFLLFFELIRIAGAVFVGQVAYLVTLTGLGWGYVLYGETPGHWIWLAVLLVFAGVALVNLGKGARRAPAD